MFYERNFIRWNYYFKKGNKMAKDVTDEVLKLSSLEDNKENRDC